MKNKVRVNARVKLILETSYYYGNILVATPNFCRQVQEKLVLSAVSDWQINFFGITSSKIIDNLSTPSHIHTILK